MEGAKGVRPWPAQQCRHLIDAPQRGRYSSYNIAASAATACHVHVWLSPAAG